MRKWNAIISLTALILLLLHGILGSFQLIGAGSTAVKALAWIAVVLIAIHAILGVKFTADSLRVWKKTGAGYVRENRLFWARRISGFAVLIFLLFHMTAFNAGGGEACRLQWFTQASWFSRFCWLPPWPSTSSPTSAR